MTCKNAALLTALLTSLAASAEPGSLETSGYTVFGEWKAKISWSPERWEPGRTITVSSTLAVTDEHLARLKSARINADGLCVLVTAERSFDADGRIRQGSDERMSTLITPTGLAIEGGIQGAVTNRFGYGFRTPVDQLAAVKLPEAQHGMREVQFSVRQALPADLPPGIYRLRLDYGVTSGRNYYSLNGEAFAKRPFFQGRAIESHVYGAPIRADGVHVSGRKVEAAAIQPRLPWLLLSGYNSNGYAGVVADEDKPHFALSGRNLIPDDVILPLFDDSSRKISYNLEPQFPTDTIEARSNIPWDYTKGELSVQVTGPDGQTTDLGRAPFVAQYKSGATTRRTAFTAWRPADYGQYTVKATGWIQDVCGNSYEGGGTYRFWIAKRMTLATATFQGMAYPVGNRYGRDIGFAPAVPADVEVRSVLYVNSDPRNSRPAACTGKASPAGVFGSAQGMQPLPFDAPGEYLGHVLARYKDKDGHLWVCSMRHAGVVYPADTPIVARGKMLPLKGKVVERGETSFEGWVDTATETNHLAHLNYPYRSGDVLLIASEGQGANKIEPVLTWETREKPAPWDTRLNGIGVTNLKLQTANGYSPHLFPEYITDWMYYYSGAPRPGFMSRFLVGEDGVRAPYWPTSPNSFGGQINASTNGDLPGDIYRLVGGVVVRKKDQAPMYAGYLSSAFLLPKGTNNNRVIAPGSEDLIGPTGQTARFFLVGTRPGMLYETGTSFAPAVQIDPILPANISFVLLCPDGRQLTASGTGDVFGSFAGRERLTLDQPGLYRFFLDADWEGYKGFMPGLPKTGGEIYVIEKDQPADAPRLKLDLPEQYLFPLGQPLRITGSSTAREVHFAAVIPGAVLGQGELGVSAGKFEYILDPAALNRVAPTYDIVNRITGNREIKDVIHLGFFSAEQARDGKIWHSFVRLVIRGNRVLYTR